MMAIYDTSVKSIDECAALCDISLITFPTSIVCEMFVYTATNECYLAHPDKVRVTVASVPVGVSTVYVKPGM
jgi:hypothetical protein